MYCGGARTHLWSDRMPSAAPPSVAHRRSSLAIERPAANRPSVAERSGRVGHREGRGRRTCRRRPVASAYPRRQRCPSWPPCGRRPSVGVGVGRQQCRLASEACPCLHEHGKTYFCREIAQQQAVTQYNAIINYYLTESAICRCFRMSKYPFAPTTRRCATVQRATKLLNRLSTFVPYREQMRAMAKLYYMHRNHLRR